jgi:hypothetical protein
MSTAPDPGRVARAEAVVVSDPGRVRRGAGEGDGDDETDGVGAATTECGPGLSIATRSAIAPAQSTHEPARGNEKTRACLVESTVARMGRAHEYLGRSAHAPSLTAPNEDAARQATGGAVRMGVPAISSESLIPPVGAPFGDSTTSPAIAVGWESSP